MIVRVVLFHVTVQRKIQRQYMDPEHRRSDDNPVEAGPESSRV